MGVLVLVLDLVLLVIERIGLVVYVVGRVGRPFARNILFMFIIICVVIARNIIKLDDILSRLSSVYFLYN